MNDMLGKEVYVITDSTEFEVADTTIVETWGELRTSLQACDPTVCNETQVFHGHITSAMQLPPSLEGKTAFIIIYDSNDPSKAVVYESASEDIEAMSIEIEEAIATNSDFDLTINIEDIFILYGYQMNVSLAVSEEEVDEELLEACERIAKKAIGGN